MTQLENRLEKVKSTFSSFDNWEDKYTHLISIGKQLKEMDPELKCEQNLVKGCISQVWIVGRLDGEQISFSADSDAAITKGIIALIVSIFNQCRPEEILKNDFSFIDEIGLRQHLSLNRANGLASMLKQIKFYAMAFQAKLNS